MRRLLISLSGAVVLLVATPSPVAAHAELTSTDPVGGAVLNAPPEQIALFFSESVVASPDAIRLYDAKGDTVNTGRAEHPNAQSNGIAAQVPGLEDGVYIVTWNVTSADSHPVHGAFTFRIGDAPVANTEALFQELLNAEGGSTSVGVAYGVVRFLAFLALTVLLGGAGFVLALWPTGAVLPKTRRLLNRAWIATLVTTSVTFCLQAAYARSRPLGDALRWSVINDVFDTRFGRAWLIRLAMVLGSGPLLWLALRTDHRRRRQLTAPLAMMAAVVLVTPGAAGHPGADSSAVLAVALDAVHLGAVSFWVGGLVLLAVVVLHSHAERIADAEGSADIEGVAALDGIEGPIRRFSSAAMIAVGMILVTGVYQGWRQSRSIDAVTDTNYGRMLIIKLALFAGMIVLAAFSRNWVRRRAREAAQNTVGTGSPTSIGQLRRSVGGEALIAVVVLAVTALLVNAVPARSALARPFTAEMHTNSVLIDLTVDPAKSGPIDIHTNVLTHSGSVTDVEELTIQLTLPGRSIGPLRVPLQRAGRGHYAAYGFDIPIPGEWLFEVTARTTDINQETVTTSVRIH